MFRFIRLVAVMGGSVAVALVLLTLIVSLIPTRFDRSKVQAKWGQEFSDFFYGVCDPDFQEFIARRKAQGLDGAEVSQRFTLIGATDTADILPEEDGQILEIIDRAFGWKPSPEINFKVFIRENGYVTFHPIHANVEGIELDECGYLIGDDYNTRLKHAQ